MKNSIADLNNYLFEQIERLQNDDLTAEELKAEVTRADAVSKISTNIIKGAEIALKAAALQTEYAGNVAIPDMIAPQEKKKIERRSYNG